MKTNIKNLLVQLFDSEKELTDAEWTELSAAWAANGISAEDMADVLDEGGQNLLVMLLDAKEAGTLAGVIGSMAEASHEPLGRLTGVKPAKVVEVDASGETADAKDEDDEIPDLDDEEEKEEGETADLTTATQQGAGGGGTAGGQQTANDPAVQGEESAVVAKPASDWRDQIAENQGDDENSPPSLVGVEQTPAAQPAAEKKSIASEAIGLIKSLGGKFLIGCGSFMFLLLILGFLAYSAHFIRDWVKGEPKTADEEAEERVEETRAATKEAESLDVWTEARLKACANQCQTRDYCQRMVGREKKVEAMYGPGGYEISDKSWLGAYPKEKCEADLEVGQLPEAQPAPAASATP